MTLTAKERFFALLDGKPADRPAVINPVSLATHESLSALKLDFSKVHLAPDNAAALAGYGYEKLRFDSVMPYFSVVAEGAALGAAIDWGNNKSMPAIRSAIFDEPDHVKIPAGYLDRPSMRCVLEALKLLFARYNGKALIIGKAMGPWTLCMSLYGMENTLVDTIENRDKLKHMLCSFLDFTGMFIEAQLYSGADMVTVADHVTRNLVGPYVYEEFVMPLHRRLNDKFPGKLILHCCGNTEDRVGLFAKAGFNLYHFESSNDILIMLERAGNMKLTGCLNNPELLMKGNPEDVIAETERIIRLGVDIVSPECAVPLLTPNRNLTAIVKGAFF